MAKVHACLLGKWVCLNDDPDCKIGAKSLSPDQWYEEGAEIFAPIKRNSSGSYYNLDYVDIIYYGKSYRINPILLQVTEI